jgi:hypothetical protein
VQVSSSISDDGAMSVWAEPFIKLRLPKMLNLRTDPCEFADITSNTYSGGD